MPYMLKIKYNKITYNHKYIAVEYYIIEVGDVLCIDNKSMGSPEQRYINK